MTNNEKYSIVCFIHNSIFCAAWFIHKEWISLLMCLGGFYAILGTVFLLKDWFSSERKSQRELRKELRMRAGQLASGDYKVCGHSAEEIGKELWFLLNKLK